MIIPRRPHHARTIRFHKTQCAVNGIPYAVHQTHLGLHAILHLNGNGVIRHKLYLCGHDCFSGAALRQCIGSARPIIFITDAGQYHQVHKFFDKRRFPRAHRPNCRDINITASPTGNVLKNIDIFHTSIPPYSLTLVSYICLVFRDRTAGNYFLLELYERLFAKYKKSLRNT